MSPASHARLSSLPPNKNAKVIGKRPRMSRFLYVLIAITVAVHLPFVAAVGYLATTRGWPTPWLIAWCAGAAGVTVFAWRARAGSLDRRVGPLVPRFVDVPYFIHWCACVWCMVPSLVSLVVAPIADLAQGAPLALPLRFYFWLYVAGLVVCGYGVLIRRKWFVVKDVEIRLPGLDPKYDGYTIAHLSDLHIGTLTPKTTGFKWTRAANARKPDLAVVTGDMVTSGTAYHLDIAEVVGSLEAKDGTFVSMGNHDYFGDGEPLISLIEARGVRVLRNEGHLLERDGGRLYLAAIDDTWTKRDDIQRALAGCPEGVKTVLLAHDPERFPRAVERNVALTLSGHTHGGQIAMPFLSRWVSLARIAHHYNVGIYREKGSTMYVHPGLGTTGPPMRLGVAPAVVILTLRSA